jgi:arylsulfatase A
LGKPNAKGREYIVSQDNGRRGNYGLRIGNWKLQRHDSKKMYNGDLSMKTWPVPQYTLYDLSVDIEEKNDISEQNKNIFNKLKNKLQDIIDNGRTRS